MKASESLQRLYEIIEKLKGPLEAKNFVSGEINIIISDLQDEKLPITAEAIDERLAKTAHEFITVTKNKNDVA